MTNLIENFRDADGEQIQPYFAAFMIEHGYSRAKEAFQRHGNGAEFLSWIQARWREFEKPHGFCDTQRRVHADAFRLWLADRVLDSAARNFVEAA